MLFSRQDDIKDDMERLRFEQSEVYRLFTENDNKIVDDYLKNKEKIDKDIALFKTKISVFDNAFVLMKNMIEQQNLTVSDCDKRMDKTQDAIVAVK